MICPSLVRDHVRSYPCNPEDTTAMGLFTRYAGMVSDLYSRTGRVGFEWLAMWVQVRRRRTHQRGREMGIIAWIVVGLIAGALAKFILPGDDPGGIIVTILIGIAGAFVGGFVFGLVGGTGMTGFSIWSIIVATIGAIILLLLYRLIASRTT
jgi:uncharacterized membrane protein YeaQ/YmgE (transglycosylase-associated protein family)